MLDEDIRQLDPCESEVLHNFRRKIRTFPLSLNLRPTLDYRPDEKTVLPPTIDPNTYKQITKKEQVAHDERQEIRGRLRRHYWKLAYHPEHGKHWSPALGDPMVARWGHARSVWHIENTFRLKGLVKNRKGMAWIGLLGAFFYVAKYHDPFNKNTQKSIVDWLAEEKV